MGHWYDKAGNPVYTIVGKNGKERPTDLRDAKKYGYATGVTTVIAEAASLALTKYHGQQVLNACIINPYWGDQDVNEYSKKILTDADQHRKESSERGSLIHDALEYYYTYKDYKKDLSVIDRAIIENVVEFMNNTFPNIKWKAETSFYHPLGFGGKIDLHSAENKIVLDFKTKSKNEKEFTYVKAYDAHHMQTAAYTKGLNFPSTAKRYNLFISTKEPGVLKLTESLEFEREWGMFEHLLKFWQLRNNYFIRD